MSSRLPPVVAKAAHIPLVRWLLTTFRVDFAPQHRQPLVRVLVLATLLALTASLLADTALVAIGTAVFPSTKGYPHFQFHDYARLTVIGVVIACLAWPIVTRITSTPRWLFFRMAIVVTLVLFLPDLYLLAKGQPAKAVAVLMLMHLAIAILTYNSLVHLARVRSLRPLEEHAGAVAGRHLKDAPEAPRQRPAEL